MGLHFFSDGNYTPPNPDPKRFRIIHAEQIGNYLVAMIKFFDCTTFEGTKILVFKNTTYNQLHVLKEIDPHFLENNNVVARIRPDNDGFAIARDLARYLDKYIK